MSMPLVCEYSWASVMAWVAAGASGNHSPTVLSQRSAARTDGVEVALDGQLVLFRGDGQPPRRGKVQRLGIAVDLADHGPDRGAS